MTYTSMEAIVRTVQREPRTVPGDGWENLRLHEVAAELLGRPDAQVLFPAPPTGTEIGITADDRVVRNTHTFHGMGAKDRARLKRVREPELTDPDKPEDDAAVIAGVAVKDVLAGTKDPIALGRAWAAFRRFVGRSDRPSKGYKHEAYVRRHGMSAADRLALVIRDTFGVGDDQLRRLEAVLALPEQLHFALRAREVGLKTLSELAKNPDARAAVVAALKGGMSAVEAVGRYFSPAEHRPEARTVLRRLVRAGHEAVDHLAGRVGEIGYLEAEERAGLEGVGELIDALLALPSRADVVADLARALSAAGNSRNGAA